jgi:hypothetical protein
MEMRLYVIYDKVAQESGPLFSAVNDGVAIRNFRGILKDVTAVDKDSYRLFFIGTYDNVKMNLVESMPDEIYFESEVKE